MRLSRSPRRWVLLPLAAIAFAGCGTKTGPAAVPGTSGISTTTSPSTSASASAGFPPATEPVVAETRLRTILLRAADVPAGFQAVTVTTAADDVAALTACGQRLAATQGAIAKAQVTYARAQDHLRMTELLMSFASTASAGAAVANLARLPAHCPVDGPTVVRALAPPAVGEDVAGAQLATPSAVTQIAIVRSGVIDAVVVVSGPPPAAPGTWMSVVKAAGTALAVGTGG